ncbi:MAG: ethylbenzene dehydrogenase-related protein [Dehalococcoidia bacterium]
MQRLIRLGAVTAALAALALLLTLGGGGSVKADLSLQGAAATPTIDGDNADWAGIAGLDLTLEQFVIPAGSEWEFDPVAPLDATLKVASDDTNIYVLLEVDDTFDFVLEDHRLSAALAVMFRIDAPAGSHMGSGDDDLEAGLGMVDIWHWELDCAAGALSGGGDPGSGNDPDCNLDDEYSTDPEEREDDDSATAENSLAGSWSHTAAAIGGEGTWIFEMSRPLNTGDANDAQFTAGGTAALALAYWDPKESLTGWSDAGHLVTSDVGWINVTLAAGATATPAPTAAPTDAPAATVTPAAPPTTGGSPTSGGGTSAATYALIVLGGMAALVGIGVISLRVRSR